MGRNKLALTLLSVGLVGVAPLAAQVHGSASNASHQTGSVEVSLAYRGGALVVPVTASDGSTLYFGLTTSTDRTVLSRSGQAKVDGATLSLGGIAVPTDPVAVVPDTELTVDGLVLDGQIGPNVLSDYNVLIDAPGGRFLLQPTGRGVAWEGMRLSEPVSLRVFHGTVMSLDVMVNGKETRAALALGSRPVIANEGLQNELGLEDQGTVTLGVGGASIPGVPVRVLDLDVFDRWAPNGGAFALVGAAFLERCAISLSWVHREMRTCLR